MRPAELLYVIALLGIVQVLLGQTITFEYGVVSGEVSNSSAILWTRTSSPANLTAQVSLFPSFNSTVFEVTGLQTNIDTDFTVFAPVLLPEAGQTYYYRFVVANNASSTDLISSPVGKFKTLPNESTDILFGWTGDSDGVKNLDGTPYFNNYEVFEALRAENPDFFIYLGDTIYSDSVVRQRLYDDWEAVSKSDYEALYKENRLFENLRNLLLNTSTYVQWDDHEVYNNWRNEINSTRAINGKAAFMEYWPISNTTNVSLMSETCIAEPMFRTFRISPDIDLIILDERSCRSRDSYNVTRACGSGAAKFFFPTSPPHIREELDHTLFGILRGYATLRNIFAKENEENGTSVQECWEQLNSPERTMLGTMQKQYFLEALKNSTATYKIVANELPISHLFLDPYDRWEGYPHERREILEFIQANNISNVVFLTTDVHFNLINHVYIDPPPESSRRRAFDDYDYDDDDHVRERPPTQEPVKPVATELIVGPVAQQTPITAVQFQTGNLLFRLIRRELADFAFRVLNAGYQPKCKSINTYSYGTVRFSSVDKSLKLELKDPSGKVIRDDENDDDECSVTLPSESHSFRFNMRPENSSHFE